MIIYLIAGLIKKTLHKMSQYFHKLSEPFGEEINVKVDLSNYATKTYLKKATGVDTSNLAAKSDLASLNRCRQIKHCSCWFKQAKQWSK